MPCGDAGGMENCHQRMKSVGNCVPHTLTPLRGSVWRCGSAPLNAGQQPRALSARPHALARVAEIRGRGGIIYARSHAPGAWERRHFSFGQQADERGNEARKVNLERHYGQSPPSLISDAHNRGWPGQLVVRAWSLDILGLKHKHKAPCFEQFFRSIHSKIAFRC